MDVTVEHVHERVEFYMGTVEEEEQSFNSLINQLHYTFQSGKTISYLRGKLDGQAQKKSMETEDAFTDDI